MPVFVAVVILGVGFFLSCLLAIQLDERRRRRHPGSGTSRELTPLGVIPASARTRKYRQVIAMPSNRMTQGARPHSKPAGPESPPRAMGRAAGGSPFTDLS